MDFTKTAQHLIDEQYLKLEKKFQAILIEARKIAFKGGAGGGDNGMAKLKFISISADYTIRNESLIFADESITVTLPSPESRVAGDTTRPFTIKNIGSGVITLSESVDGCTMIQAGESFTIASDGTNYFVI